MCNIQNTKSRKTFSFPLREGTCTLTFFLGSVCCHSKQTPSSKAREVGNVKEGPQTCMLKGGRLWEAQAGTEGVLAAQALALSSCARETDGNLGKQVYLNRFSGNCFGLTCQLWS